MNSNNKNSKPPLNSHRAVTNPTNKLIVDSVASRYQAPINQKKTKPPSNIHRAVFNLKNKPILYRIVIRHQAAIYLKTTNC